MGPTSVSTVTLQNEVDNAKLFADINPIFINSGYEDQPALQIANIVMNAICAVPFPHKWNEIDLPLFYNNSYQQDYAGIYPNGTSILNLAWLERGIVVDISNTSQPKPFRHVEVGRQLPQATGSVWNPGLGNPLFLLNFFPNNVLYYGTWGQSNVDSPTYGNNPQPGSIYTPPTGYMVSNAYWLPTAGGQITFVLNAIPGGLKVGGNLTISGAFPITYNNSYTVVGINGLDVIVTSTFNPGTYLAGANAGPVNSLPVNPITQIQDANGNLLVLTTYGTEGTAAPLAPPNAPAGTTAVGAGANTVWTVVDPVGQGFRILPVPGQTGIIWQFSLVGQAKPVRFTSLSQYLTPLPDEMEPHFFAGFIAQSYRFSPEAKIREKFKSEWVMWLQSLNEMRAKQDREQEENVFTPERGIMGARMRNGWPGGAYPFNLPGSWGGY